MSTYPYLGTLEELRRVQEEIRELQAEQEQLALQARVLQNHRLMILEALRDNATGGGSHATDRSFGTRRSHQLRLALGDGMETRPPAS